ncbi:MAG: hypothetical protein JW953_01530 [Anaerolineae bacterium]|nr:hypothetical protein [Anaerolineae bacterium]
MAKTGAAKVEIDGLKETQDKLVQVAQLITEGGKGLLSRSILRLHRYMTGIVQVDTGRLKNSLHPFVEDREANIRTNVVYALPLEYMAGGKYSYIRETARDEGANVAAQIVSGLQGEISDAFGA